MFNSKQIASDKEMQLQESLIQPDKCEVWQIDKLLKNLRRRKWFKFKISADKETRWQKNLEKITYFMQQNKFQM